MAFCPTCKRSYPDGHTRCPVDASLLRNVEPTQSLAISGAGASSELAPPPLPHTGPSIEATSAENPTARGKLATGSRPDELTSNERPGRPRPRRTTTEHPEDRVGRVLGKYRLVELIGRGGMGCVYRAEHIKLGRAVALKLLRSSHSERRDAVARFFQEARAVNRIRHRNIVDVTDFVELDDGTTFIIMELLEGSSLRALMRESELAGPRVLAMMIQICDALAAAHDVGIVHRDLKPDNIFVVPTGNGSDLVKLLDFGVAKLLVRDDDDSLAFETAAGAVVGTPAYMSPEQAGGLDVDGRSDIYSLGAIMYELFTGQPPFRGKSFGEYVRKHLSEDPIAPRLTTRGAAIDPLVEDMLMRCLEKHPDDRYPDVAALRQELVMIFAGAETSISMVMDSAILDEAHVLSGSRSTGDTTTPETAMSISDVAAGDEPASTLPWGWMLGLTAAAAALALVIVFVIGNSGSTVRKDDDPTPSNTTTTGPDERRDQKPEPNVAPLPNPTRRDVKENLITVLFESMPKAAVYRSDSSTALCETPCNVTVNTLDGGSTVSRNFLLRADGYRDEPVSINLLQPAAKRLIRLQPLHSRRTTKPVGKSPDTNQSSTVQPKRNSTTSTDVKAPDGKDKPKPKGTPTIDPTTTIDPFSKK